MKTVVLIDCGRTKMEYACAAMEMWSKGRLFMKTLTYARTLAPDEDIYTLSFKYGAVALTDVIEPYNQHPTSFTKPEQFSAMMKALARLSSKYDLESTNFVLLNSAPFLKYLTPLLPHYEVPFESMRMGERMGFMSGHTGIVAENKSLRERVTALEQIVNTLAEKAGISV